MARLLKCFSLLGLAVMFMGNVDDVQAQRRPGRHPGGNGGPTIRVLIGTYTDGESKGIYRSEFNLKTGELAPVELAAELANPSFLTLSPEQDFVYAVSETEEYEGTPSGSVAAYKLGPDGGLTFLNQQTTDGGAPCHLVTDDLGKTLFVANYSGGSVAVVPIKRDGSLQLPLPSIKHQGSGPNADRQTTPHAHSVTMDASNRILVVADLGLDKLMLYRYSPKFGAIAPHDPQPDVALAPGAGPRHFAFHPDGRHAYVINELDSTITALAFDAVLGTFKKLDTVSTLPEGGHEGNSTADIHVHPSGRWLYGSNRGHDSIAMFSIEQGSGKLSPMGHEKTGGKTPRNFTIDPSGRYLLAANQGSGFIRVFKIDPKTGKLESTGHDLQVPSPVCVKMFAVDALRGALKAE